MAKSASYPIALTPLDEAGQCFGGSTLGSVERARKVSGVREARFAARKRHVLRPDTGDPRPLNRNGMAFRRLVRVG